MTLASVFSLNICKSRVFEQSQSMLCQKCVEDEVSTLDRYTLGACMLPCTMVLAIFIPLPANISSSRVVATALEHALSKAEVLTKGKKTFEGLLLEV